MSGTPYCMGERTGGAGAITGAEAGTGGVGGTDDGRVAEAGGATEGSGRGLGAMCFKRLFL